MNINATLIFQSIAFLLFVAFTWKYVWPPILQAMHDRQARIADGLANADKGNKALAEAEAEREQMLGDARKQAQDIMSAANKQAAQVVEQAQEKARSEAERIRESAEAEADREINKAREQLRKQVGDLAVLGAARIVKREIDASKHAEVLSDVAAQL